MSCPAVITINNTECIGNSLTTINSNFTVLKNAACDNYSTISTLLSSIQTLDNRIVNLSQKTPGIAKAWVVFDGTKDSGGTVSSAATNRYIYSSYNVDSVYKTTTTNTPTTSGGDYRIYFKSGIITTTNYAVVGTSSEKKGTTNYGWLQPYSFNVSYVGVRVHPPTYPGDVVDPSRISVAIFG
jgi:hypothetical protein